VTSATVSIGQTVKPVGLGGTEPRYVRLSGKCGLAWFPGKLPHFAGIPDFYKFVLFSLDDHDDDFLMVILL